MRGSFQFKKDYAVSEIVGGIILVLIAVAVFSVIYLDVTSKDLDVYHTNVKLQGSVNDTGFIVLEHKGGDVIKSYKVYVSYPNGTMISSETYEDNWAIGEYKYPTDIKLVDGMSLSVAVYTVNEDGKEQEIFKGELLYRKDDPPASSTPPDSPSWDPTIPLLISSLRNDTIDEDLICFNFTENISIDPSTYIYKWMVNGNPLNEILLPFDTENTTVTKDYSGNGFDGTINGATWTSNGVVGGSYYFGGASDYITTGLPSVFDDILNNDLAISIWLKSDDTTDDNRVALHASKDNKHFIKIFQFGTEVHFGVCYDGTKDAVRTENLSSNTWYHIAGLWDASEKTISLYVNGERCTETGYRNFALGSGTGFELGHGSASSRFWLGFIDEVEFFDYIISQEQIYQIYMCKKDGFSDKSVIVSDETTLGDIWQCIVTPSDGSQDDTAVESNLLQIISYSGGE